jgi:hypothetical protein
MAYDYLNKQIDRNIQAQKDRFGQAQTVWGAYKDLYGNEQVANNLARVHQLDMLNTQGQMTAAQLGTPTAAKNYADLASKLTAEKNKLYLDSAGNLASTPNMGGSGSTQSGQTNIGQGPMSPSDVASLKNSLIGPPEANASIPQKEQYSDSHILVPNANDILHSNVQYGGSKAREDYPAAEQQLRNAQIADRSMEKITALFPQIKSKANYAGAIGSAINPHAIAAVAGGLGALAGAIPTGGIGAPVGAGIGAAIGEGAGHALKGAADLVGGNKEIQYQALKGELKKLIIAALPNASGSEIDDIVEKQVPGVRDNDETGRIKLNAIREFIKTKTPRDLLDNYKMSTK